MVNLTGGLGSLAKSALILVIGLGLLAGGWSFYQGGQEATENAVEVEGTVLSTSIVEVEVSDEEGRHIEYAPEIAYRYTVEGESYTSMSICPGTAEGCEASNARGRDEVADFLTQYPEGEPVTIYVLPDEPSRSFLANTESGFIGYLFMMGIGGVLVLGGLFAVAGSLKELVIG
jgi:hypothetical protein